MSANRIEEKAKERTAREEGHQKYYDPPSFCDHLPPDVLTLDFDRVVSSPEQVPDWQAVLRQKLMETLNLPAHVLRGDPPLYQVLERRQKAGYEQIKINFPCFDGDTVIAYLLIPPTAAGSAGAPGVLVIHGHDHGARSAIGEIASQDGQEGVAQFLAQNGYAVVVPELRTFGERALPAYPNISGKISHEIYANYVMALGRPLLMLHLAEALQANFILRHWPGVDGARVAVIGLSQGGRLASFAAGLDDRFQACLVASGLCHFTKLYRGLGHLHDELLGWLRYADYDDVAALVAPRPLLLTYGAQEWGFYGIEATQGISFQRIAKVYRMLGAEGRARLEVHPQGHAYDLPTVLRFLAEHLPREAPRV
jgi:dienelactone hydrolase